MLNDIRVDGFNKTRAQLNSNKVENRQISIL